MPRVKPKRVRDAERAADRAFSRAMVAEATRPTYGTAPYGLDSKRSWFFDLAWSTANPAQLRELGPPPAAIGNVVQARDRLGIIDHEERSRGARVEQRDLTTLSTDGGGFIPPKYLADEFVAGVRSAGVLTDVLPVKPLPETGMTLSTARITTGVAASIQATENTSITASDIVEASVTSPVGTISSEQSLSTQLWDRAESPGGVAGAEGILAFELGRAMAARRDHQLLYGTGSNGQVHGLTQVGSIGTTAYTDASPTQAEAWPKLMEAVAELTTDGGFPEATAILAHPRRFAWFAAWKDASTGAQATITWPATPYSVPSITTIAGAGTNEDEILVLRREELPVYLGPVQFEAYPEVKSGTLTVRVVAWQYAATMFGRAPHAINYVSGTGLAAPAFA